MRPVYEPRLFPEKFGRWLLKRLTIYAVVAAIAAQICIGVAGIRSSGILVLLAVAVELAVLVPIGRVPIPTRWVKEPRFWSVVVAQCLAAYCVIIYEASGLSDVAVAPDQKADLPIAPLPSNQETARNTPPNPVPFTPGRLPRPGDEPPGVYYHFVTSVRVGFTALVLTPERAKAAGVAEDNGLLVTGVVVDSPAAVAGLKPGDVISAVGAPGFEDEPVAAAPATPKPEPPAPPEPRKVPVLIKRDGQPQLLNFVIE